MGYQFYFHVTQTLFYSTCIVSREQHYVTYTMTRLPPVVLKYNLEHD
jgi:hypothetical protein